MRKMAVIFAGKYCPRFTNVFGALRVKINFTSTSSTVTGGQRWRVNNGLAGDGLAYGPLTDLPDWSYADGESATESKRRRKRQNKRLREAERVIQYLKEVDQSKQDTTEDN